MKTTRMFLTGMMLFLISLPVVATKVTSLYQAEVPVNTQSLDDRKRGMQQALTYVLIKVSGNTEINQKPRVKERLLTADTLAQEYAYTKFPGNNKTYLLQVRFDENAINHLLRDVNAPVWGHNRPQVLGLILYETPQVPEILHKNSTNDLAIQLKNNANRRGLPFVLPRMDTNDMNQINANDITQPILSRLTSAAKRYTCPAFLSGHVIENPNGITSQWTLVFHNDQWNWNINGSKLQDIIPKIIDMVTNTLASRYALITTNDIQKHISLKVTGITQQSDFTKLIRYLNHLSPVVHVGILKINRDTVLLQISLRSTEEVFIHTIAMGEMLIPNTKETNPSSLIYAWNHQS